MHFDLALLWFIMKIVILYSVLQCVCGVASVIMPMYSKAMYM